MLEGIIKRLKAEIARIEAHISENWDAMTEDEQNEILEVLAEKYSLLRDLEKG